MDTMELTNKEITDFQNTVFDFYTKNKRIFPWRNTNDTYSILVSEMMLQQTQTERVLPKYESWMERFPDVQALANASFSDVLTEWNGLGYNRRARYLHDACIEVVKKYDGIFPKSAEVLQTLPGIGPYTSRAVSTFAYNNPEIFIETNIRSVYIFFFFSEEDKAVADRELIPLIEQTLYRNSPREWYYALMDYGAELKRNIQNPNRKSRHYTKQSKFEGSLRQARGAIIRYLTAVQGNAVLSDIAKKEAIDYARVLKAVAALEEEGFIIADNGVCCLKEKK